VANFLFSVLFIMKTTTFGGGPVKVQPIRREIKHMVHFLCLPLCAIDWIDCPGSSECAPLCPNGGVFMLRRGVYALKRYLCPEGVLKQFKILIDIFFGAWQGLKGKYAPFPL
jgi:hypothetical protein